MVANQVKSLLNIQLAITSTHNHFYYREAGSCWRSFFTTREPSAEDWGGGTATIRLSRRKYQKAVRYWGTPHQALYYFILDRQDSIDCVYTRSSILVYNYVRYRLSSLKKSKEWSRNLRQKTLPRKKVSARWSQIYESRQWHKYSIIIHYVSMILL